MIAFVSFVKILNILHLFSAVHNTNSSKYFLSDQSLYITFLIFSNFFYDILNDLLSRSHLVNAFSLYFDFPIISVQLFFAIFKLYILCFFWGYPSTMTTFIYVKLKTYIPILWYYIIFIFTYILQYKQSSYKVYPDNFTIIIGKYQFYGEWQNLTSVLDREFQIVLYLIFSLIKSFKLEINTVHIFQLWNFVLSNLLFIWSWHGRIYVW